MVLVYNQFRLTTVIEAAMEIAGMQAAQKRLHVRLLCGYTCLTVELRGCQHCGYTAMFVQYRVWGWHAKRKVYTVQCQSPPVSMQLTIHLSFSLEVKAVL